MPMTTEEDTLSYILGDRSGSPIVGMSRHLPGVAVVHGHIEWRDNLKTPVAALIGICDKGTYQFDCETASWKRVWSPEDFVPSLGYTGTPWSDGHEVALEQLRAY